MAALMADLAPPVRVRWTGPRIAVVAMSTAVLLGAAIAVVMQIRPRVVAPDNPTPTYDDAGNQVSPTKVLIDKLNEQAEIIRILEKKLQHAIERGEASAETIKELRHELTVAEEIRSRLLDEIEKKPKVIYAPPKGVAVGPTQSELVVGVVDSAQGPIEGCFIEWNDRHPGSDVDMMVRLTVNSNGVGHSAVATGIDSPSFKFCTEAALMHNVVYPNGPEQLSLDVRIVWSGRSRMLSLQPRVVGRRLVPRGGIDLE